MSLEFYIFDTSFDIVAELRSEAKKLTRPQKVRFAPHIVKVTQSLKRAEPFRKTFNSDEALDTAVAGLFITFFSKYILVNGKPKRIKDPGVSFYEFVLSQVKKRTNKYSIRRSHLDKYLRTLIDPVRATIESYMNIRTALTALKQIK